MPINLQNFTKLYENKHFSYLKSWKSGVTTASSEILVIDTCVSMWIFSPAWILVDIWSKIAVSFVVVEKIKFSFQGVLKSWISQQRKANEFDCFFLRYFNLHRFFAPTFRQSKKASAYVSIVVECEPRLVVHFWVSFLHEFVCIIQFAT